jgi:WD40 repeat protein
MGCWYWRYISFLFSNFRIWIIYKIESLHTLLGHTAEIVSLDFDTSGQKICTGSFDNTVKIWDVLSGRCIHTLLGHQGEISSCQFNYASDLCISGSIDRTCKVLILFVLTCIISLWLNDHSICLHIKCYVGFIYLYIYLFRFGMWKVVHVYSLLEVTPTKYSTSLLIQLVHGLSPPVLMDKLEYITPWLELA